jgi:hypothetical protein
VAIKFGTGILLGHGWKFGSLPSSNPLEYAPYTKTIPESPATDYIEAGAFGVGLFGIGTFGLGEFGGLTVPYTTETAAPTTYTPEI